MDFAELVRKNRTYRRFDQSFSISKQTLRALVDLARLTPSARNAQPLKYALICDPAANAKIFPTLAWAGYLADWPGPVEGERPSAYIIVLGDKEIAQNFNIDPGIAVQTILLGAVAQGLGGCIIASVNRKELIPLLQIPDRYEVLFVLALGKPVEEVVIDPIAPPGDIKYWRDEKHVHHVPKRALDDLIVDL